MSESSLNKYFENIPAKYTDASVVARFQIIKIALIADIKEIFLSVRNGKKDWDALRLLWSFIMLMIQL